MDGQIDGSVSISCHVSLLLLIINVLIKVTLNEIRRRGTLQSQVDRSMCVLCELFNRSLTTATVPEAFKFAYVTPRLKKQDLDADDVRSYRPISNLSVISKLLERLVHQQRSEEHTSELQSR